VLVMISSMYVPICNHFHVRRANNGRIMPFLRAGAPLSPLVRGDPFTQQHEILSEILETLSYHIFISPELQSVPGRDRHQDRITMWLIRVNLLTRVKTAPNSTKQELQNFIKLRLLGD